MEHKKKFHTKKEGDARITVRPGNFIVPGEKPQQREQQQARREATDTDKRPQGSGEAGRNGSNNGNGHHRRGHRNRRTHNNGNANANAAPRQNEARAEASTKNEPVAKQNQENGKKGQEGRHGKNRRRHQEPRANAAPTQATPAPTTPTSKPTPEISPSLQRELDAQFSAPVSLPSSPVAAAERHLSEEERAALEKEFAVDIATAAYLVEDIPCGFPTPNGNAVEVIGVRFRKTGKVYFFSPAGERFKIGEAAIVDTARGPELGEVAMLNRKMAEKDIIQPLRAVIRRANAEDIAHHEENRKKEAEALKVCGEKIAAHKLDMHLVDAQYAFDNSKLLFYFTSEGRVDFRELVRDLAGVFRTRIELRQIGIRDESRLVGGLGMCGRPFCCATFLSDFGQVSVKMAKEQGLSINTSKISGCCGRLMCCLRYEHESYAAEAALTPKKDARVLTPDGQGTVVETTPLLGTVKVLLDNAEGNAPQTYHRDTVTVLDKGKKEAEKAPVADTEAAQSAPTNETE